MFKNASLQFKIIFSVIAYIVIIGVSGNVFLFKNLQETVFRKSEQLDRAHAEAARFQIDRHLSNVLSLAAVSASSLDVLQLVFYRDRPEQEMMRRSLAAQERIDSYLMTSPVKAYIDKLILFDRQGLFVQAGGRQPGSPMDLYNILQQPLYAALVADNLPWADGFGRSISGANQRDCYILLYRVPAPYDGGAGAYIYIEAGIDMITSVFRNFGAPQGVFAKVPTGEVILPDSLRLTSPEEGSLGYVPPDIEFPHRFRQGRSKYFLDKILLENEIIVLYNLLDLTSINVDDRRTFYTITATVLLSLFAAGGMGLIMSVFFTRPIRAVINRIKKISEDNDFSPDPDIEKRGDEIGRIGKAVNEMSGSIARYLGKIEEQYREQKNTEIALLQTEINPHFLYNTLDSIQWVAKIQNNTAIADVINRLINLLREIAGQAKSGKLQKITLAEELLILEDYVEIMSLRFMGAFEVVNKIPKDFLHCCIPRLTLQPLVENAILHGIVPSARFGVITLNAFCEENFLNITVEDTGVGIKSELLAVIKTAKRQSNWGSPSFNNIGIANVDERIKMYYGESCGLFFDSRPGQNTRVTIRIIKEEQ